MLTFMLLLMILLMLLQLWTTAALLEVGAKLGWISPTHVKQKRHAELIRCTLLKWAQPLNAASDGYPLDQLERPVIKLLIVAWLSLRVCGDAVVVC
jgi:hypothetical protein